MITKETQKYITEHMLQILKDINHVMTSDLIDTTNKWRRAKAFIGYLTVN